MLTIYGNKTFNVVKVVMAAEEIGLDYEYKMIDFTTGEMKSPEYLKIHPFGKVPAIEHNGTAIVESNNICRYLANIGGKKLYSDDPLAAAKIDEMIDFIGYHAGHTITTYFYQEIVKKAFHKAEPNKDSIAKAKETLDGQLPFIDEKLGSTEFICGDNITIADCVAFGMVMVHEYTSLDISEYENICRWYDMMKQRPSYAAMMEHIPGGYDFG
ncbi:glutathione S-transferase family protein [Pseudemcibacter aquimaris]|uniref:glutathione S-transferase family protein n=1 Tax=Pseudemcibacter aquimaris TaxID=2857064 RepID=UPI0020115BE1|nr:glutathione S-transferase family protein [Pseudemcibacter aquimaris]MCC3859657.1 glutathione S-transferase family protein [Pseudemcibacter aquimaris]WDU60052.1 glutathione S-transferase family protein [Pseudemcibacter aquimaris]